MIRSAMDDAMTDGDRIDVELVAQPGACNRHRGWHIRHGLDRIGPVGQRLARRHRWRAIADGCRSHPSGP